MKPLRALFEILKHIKETTQNLCHCLRVDNCKYTVKITFRNW